MLNRIFLTFISLFIVLTSFYLGYNVIDKKEKMNENVQKILAYYQEDNDSFTDEEKYIGILEIPSINLKRGFYDKTSKLNVLNKNIYYLNESISLENKNSMIILAAHRGNSSVSFFNDLDKLLIGNEIILNFKNKEYKYVFTNKYNELKDGRLNIYRDEEKDSLILITCNKRRSKYQTIYVSYRKE